MNLQASDCSVHGSSSSATITMSSSSSQVQTGAQITVTVTVNGGTGSGLLGVALLSKTSGMSGTTPQENGWTIISDPEGTKYSYVEVNNAATRSVAWTLLAPSASGTYTLYAKIFDSNNPLVKIFATGISVIVSDAPAVPSIAITSPADAAIVTGNFTLAAATIGEWVMGTATLYVDGSAVQPVSMNLTWSVDTTGWALGEHTLKVVASAANGSVYEDGVTVVLTDQITGGTSFGWSYLDIAIIGLSIALASVMVMAKWRRRE